MSAEIRHGTTTAYQYHRCRCDECRDAARIAVAKWRNRNKSAYVTGCERWHGTVGGYNNHACRCDECMQAKRASSVEYYADNRDEMLSKGRESYRIDPEPKRSQNRRYREENADRENARERQRYQVDRDRILARQNRYRKLTDADVRNIERRNQKNAVAAERADSKWRRYSPEDDAVVRDPLLSQLEKALVLGRSITSIQNRTHRLNRQAVTV